MRKRGRGSRLGGITPPLAWVASAAVLAFLLQAGSQIISSSGEVYSLSVHYRLQTDALREGSIALQTTPYLHLNDWAWAKGAMQQIWGLGLPLLRLPLEVLAHAF